MLHGRKRWSWRCGCTPQCVGCSLWRKRPPPTGMTREYGQHSASSRIV